MRAIVLGVGLLATLSCAVVAQDSSSLLRKDARVRVWSQRNEWSGREGFIDAVAGDTLTMTFRNPSLEPGEPHWLQIRSALADLDSLEVGLRAARRGPGAEGGALILGGLGVVASYILVSGCGGCDDSAYVPVAVVLGTAGIVVGGLLGAVISHTRPTSWVAIPLHRTSR